MTVQYHPDYYKIREIRGLFLLEEVNDDNDQI